MERLYRDSVHNIIRVNTGTDEGVLLTRLIDTPEFQRLRRIRQLGLAFFAYQSAEHSRFTHSLGAMSIAARLLDRLTVYSSIEPIERTAVLAAALLHDVGHGPFSHVFESIVDFHHEAFTIEAIESGGTAINRTLSAFDAGLPAKVASVIRGDMSRRALAQLVSSQLDVDRMDYLLRDSLMTGAKYGIYDIEWIIRSITLDEENDRIVVTAPGVFAVEAYLQARYHMFRQVYYHRTLRAAEAVLKVMLKRALDLFANGGDVWHIAGSAFASVLAGRRLTLAEHLSLDDADVMFHIKQWAGSSDAVLADLSDRFLSRRLFKAYDLDMSDASRSKFVDAARQAVVDAGFDPEYYFVEDEAREESEFFYSSSSSNPKDLIYVYDGFSDPKVREISEVSAAVRGLQEGFRLHRLCFPGELVDVIGPLYRNTDASVPTRS